MQNFYTFFFLFQISYILVQFDYFVCPVTYDEASDNLSMDCIRHPVFILTEFSLPLVIQKFYSIVSICTLCVFQMFFFVILCKTILKQNIAFGQMMYSDLEQSQARVILYLMKTKTLPGSYIIFPQLHLVHAAYKKEFIGKGCAVNLNHVFRSNNLAQS